MYLNVYKFHVSLIWNFSKVPKVHILLNKDQLAQINCEPSNIGETSYCISSPKIASFSSEQAWEQVWEQYITKEKRAEEREKTKWV